MAKQLVGVRMSDAGRELLSIFTERMGLTQAGVIEHALRELAKKEGVPVPTTKQEKPEKD